MAKIIWTEPALGYLNAIADYIAKNNPDAANRLVRRVFESVDLLEQFPELGRRVPEMRKSGHREMIVSPCRIIYRVEGETVVVIFVMRGERELKPQEIIDADL
jgi:toxin ParE1/3/4